MKQIKPAYRVQVDKDNIEDTVERLADAFERSISSIVQSDIIAGYVLQDIDLTTSAKRIEHKLGRKPLGYVVVKKDANAVIYNQQEDREDIFLNLIASAAVRVSLWIF